MKRWIAVVAFLAAGCVPAPRPAPVIAQARIEAPAPVERAKEPVPAKPEPIAQNVQATAWSLTSDDLPASDRITLPPAA
mgnify:CR=1 FL=1